MQPPNESLFLFEERGAIVAGTVLKGSMLNPANIARLGVEALEVVGKYSKINLLISFEHVGHLSSAALSELIKIHRAVGAQQGRLRLCGISGTIAEVFKITNLDKLFQISHEGLDVDLPKFERAIALDEREKSWERLLPKSE